MNTIVVDLMTCDGKFSDEKSGCSVVFDDDGRVAYAYLLDAGNRIIGDVWLYNRCAAPLEPEWKDPEKMPFANAESYVNSSDDFEPVSEITEVKVDWVSQADQVKANVFIRNRLFAVLVEGVKPGWSFLASKDGPLAKVLEPG